MYTYILLFFFLLQKNNRFLRPLHWLIVFLAFFFIGLDGWFQKTKLFPKNSPFIFNNNEFIVHCKHTFSWMRLPLFILAMYYLNIPWCNWNFLYSLPNNLLELFTHKHRPFRNILMIFFLRIHKFKKFLINFLLIPTNPNNKITTKLTSKTWCIQLIQII